jgi:hypothetical protein
MDSRYPLLRGHKLRGNDDWVYMSVIPAEAGIQWLVTNIIYCHKYSLPPIIENLPALSQNFLQTWSGRFFQIVLWDYFMAMAAISTLTSLGKRATWTAARAG